MDSNPVGFAPHFVRLQEELRERKEELTTVKTEIRTLETRRYELECRISEIKNSLSLMHNSGQVSKDYDSDNFAWSASMMEKLRSVFRINNFRSFQKSAINVTMSNLDYLLVMPTGGGKSLCFQLPAILSNGVTLVISPLISLMEDQLNGMKELGIEIAIFNANTSKEETKRIFESMIDPKGTLKLLYTTPEKLSKYKRLMSQLEKMYRLKRFARLVIDEVHCCSEFGHDFRPDYKFLGIMKKQFPETPILGLTATATPSGILDVQKILNIEGSVIFKDSFYRSNLKYHVWDCTENSSKVDEIAKLIKTRFSNQSGIIYCLTIKDCTDVAAELRERGLKAAEYHAQLEPAQRSYIQSQWYSNKVNVICATIAFGMGINKLDVRYVIHHSISKSVENYYQETGRAGRDGNTAYCILFYKFGDVFRTSSIMFSENLGVLNVYNMLRYCLNWKDCRKKLLAQHFDDKWVGVAGNPDGCDQMCDNCQLNRESEQSRNFKTVDAGPLLDDIDNILDNPVNQKERMTPLKLIDSLYGKGKKNLRVENIQVPKYDRKVVENLMSLLLLDGFLKEEFHFTPYNTISYIVAGSKVVLRNKGKLPTEIPYQVPVNVSGGCRVSLIEKKSSSSTSTTESRSTSNNNQKPSSSKSSSSSTSQHNSSSSKRTSDLKSSPSTSKNSSSSNSGGANNKHVYTVDSDSDSDFEPSHTHHLKTKKAKLSNLGFKSNFIVTTSSSSSDEDVGSSKKNMTEVIDID